jgi:hypothetical protein
MTRVIAASPCHSRPRSHFAYFQTGFRLSPEDRRASNIKDFAFPKAANSTKADQRVSSAAFPTRRRQEQLVDALDEARTRCEINAQLAAWCVQLNGRLKRAQSAVLTYDEGVADLRDLETEWQRFKLAVRLAKMTRGAS